MNALSDFFAMGGYGFYVWTSYALAFVVMIANIVAPLRRLRRLRTDVANIATDPRTKKEVSHT
ncbi:MAG: heme exporter protein CcmD [Gammaproteobacteria bacterium]|nr:heme exporter protein CcmD [Gammaproteobacteria bacterium]